MTLQSALESLVDRGPSKALYDQLLSGDRDSINAQLSTLAKLERGIAIIDRMSSFQAMVDVLKAAQVDYSLEEIWTHLLPLADLLVAWSKAKKTTVIALAGLPGSGKTTLANAICQVIKTRKRPAMRDEIDPLALSLDDFYFTPEERKNRGLRWRAVPGSHDLQLLSQFLNDLHSDADTIAVPRYDTQAEVRLSPVIRSKPSLVLFDGWLIGARASGYEALEDAFDRIIFIDMDLEVAHQSRLRREERIREESNGRLGLSAEETELFWQEALLPTGIKCAASLRETADLVITVDASHKFISVKSRHP